MNKEKEEVSKVKGQRSSKGQAYQVPVGQPAPIFCNSGSTYGVRIE